MMFSLKTFVSNICRGNNESCILRKCLPQRHKIGDFSDNIMAIAKVNQNL